MWRLRGWAVAALAWRHLIVAMAADDDESTRTHSGDATESKSKSALLSCSGKEEEYDACEGLPECNECKPVNCVFDTWGDWRDVGGCAQLKERSRQIKTQNNECGTPCSGKRTETIRHLKKECVIAAVDCRMSDWSEWTKCTSHAGQSFRTRSIEQQPLNDGKTCDSLLHETRPCAVARPPVDCALDSWEDWTECSATCGRGQRTRLRRVEIEAERGGKSCIGELVGSGSCNVKECEKVDCKLGEWSNWSSCNFNEAQQHRQRKIVAFGSGGGTPCKDSLKQTRGCATQKSSTPVDCVLSKFGDWSECDKTCGGGQSFRKRRILVAPLNGGSCDHTLLEETKPCNSELCEPPAKRCEFSTWEDWGPCDVDCGMGSSRRERRVNRFAEVHGFGCVGPLSELKPCEATSCEIADCKWSDWHEWSGCSCSCGGGTRHRNRIVAQSPVGLGKLCEPVDKSEAEPCNTQPCTLECRDGEWSDWGEWSECSASCDSGYKTRTRHVAKPPDTCASPLEGPMAEFVPCKHLQPCTPDIDCEVSDWGEWSDCSCSCDGIRERSRVIKTFVSGKGKACDATLREMSTCNPIPGEVADPKCVVPKADCEMDDWSDWSTCTRTCGGGQREKSRSILTPSAAGGKPCEAETRVTEGCNNDACIDVKCEDCIWNEWGEWGTCFPESGQRFRMRNIKQMPNICGKMCEESDSKEIEDCPKPPAEALVCRWTEWTDANSCADTCGSNTASRNRILGFEKVLASRIDEVNHPLFHSDVSLNATCTGSQTSVKNCGTPDCNKCEPRDCKFGEWGEWTPPNCEGLCERKRVIDRSNNECGKPCEGPLFDTKKCSVVCDTPIDCEFDSWGQWSQCKSALDQKTRHRKIRVPAQRDGKACVGSTSMTLPCAGQPDVVDCKYSEWGAWDECSETCGGGVQSKVRRIVRHATPGGLSCDGDLEVFQHCNTQKCAISSQDCKLSEWESFSGCGPDNQKYRQRHVLSPATGGGEPCEGSLEETETCVGSPVDCVVSDWTPWGDCDTSCGGGQRSRVRQIHQFPKYGGKPCPSSLMETQPCNEIKCDVTDCDYKDWGDWSTCSATCGVGQSHRERAIDELRGYGGAGCGGQLTETRGCNVKDCVKLDCEWGDWQLWGDCSSSCGGGQRSRSRHIKQSPRGGGKPCDPVDREIVEPCGTDACPEHCVDGAWGNWEDWSKCSATCGGGSSTRKRNKKLSANHCGTPAVGSDHEVRFCNEDVSCQPNVDCEFAEWTDWSGCSATCDGVARRSRVVNKTGSGDGKYCEGPLKQTKACNAGDGIEGCGPTTPVDCELEDWSEWSECTVDCGGGTKERSRKIVTLAAFGGKPCDSSMRIVQECNRHSCEGPDPIDCEVGDWEHWGACSKCGGSRKRFRHITKHPLYGGAACKLEAMSEVGACPQACENEELHCGFAAWGDWGKCSATCGAATRKRTRHLVSQKKKTGVPASMQEIMSEYAALDAYTQSLEAGHAHELVLAFACGIFTLMLILGVYRFSTSSSRMSLSPRDTFLVEMDER